jgi:type I restriction enzyme S subunit
MQTVVGVGGSLLRANPNQVADITIPLPSLDEQRRIAGILDKADAIRRWRESVINLLDDLVQSIFLELFGDPTNNPRQWKLGKIGDLLESTQYGTSEKADGVGEYPILRMGNITTDGRMDFDDLKYIDLSAQDVDKYTVRRGDILFNRTNSAELVGKTAVFNRDAPFAFAGYLVRARVKSGVSPHYVSGYLNSRHGKATLRGMAKSIVGMANINAREMQSIPIVIPDSKTQLKYSQRFDHIELKRQAYTGNLKVLNSLFASLQHRAFTGQL